VDIFMMKPNFDKISKAELRAYVMSHKDDEEAFCKLVDRLKADSTNQTQHPFPKTLEDVAKVQEIIQHKIRNT
jgi:flagellar biosynthesis protein FliP